MAELSLATRVTLTTGVVVVNFNSGHPFVFDDGTVLPACEDDRVNTLKSIPIEYEHPNDKGWIDLELTFQVSDSIIKELELLEEDDEVDIILVPLLVLRGVRAWERDREWPPGFSKMRTIRKTENKRKTKSDPNGDIVPIFHNRFCLS